MPWQLDSDPVYIAADDTERVELTNSGGGTIYYGRQDVNEAENEGSLAANQAVTLKKGTYVISGGQSLVATREIPNHVSKPELEDHEVDTTDVHGVGDTEAIKGYVNHGETASTARPSGFASVEWHGSVEPENAEDGDTWIEV